MDKIGIIILAAGSSSRLGYAKQLLHYQGVSLVKKAAQAATQSGANHVVVVLGANHESISQELTDVDCIVNSDWEEGMGSSIRVGVTHLLQQNSNLHGIILSVCDQPHLTTAIFQKLYNRYLQTGRRIITSQYDDDPKMKGVPTLFDAMYFSELQTFQGEKGAKILLEKYADNVATINFEQGSIDMDTAEDTTQLMPTLISVDEATRLILAQTKAAQAVRVPLHAASGLTLAEDIFAEQDIPYFRQSSMDGYALAFADRDNSLKVVGEMRAGTTTEAHISTGEAMRVFTGAPIPEGADTVVMQEWVSRSGDQINIPAKRVLLGMNVRAKGSEVAQGDLAMTQGTYLSAAALGYLAGIGQHELSVYAAPRVTLIVTGDELLAEGSSPAFGKVYESNSVQLSAALHQANIKELTVVQVADNPEALQQVISNALKRAEIVLLVGGVSVGDYDFVVQATFAAGVSPVFHKVKQKPGKPLFFGYRNSTLLFGLPGNPSSALTCFYRYVLPAIDKMMNRADSYRITKAIAANDYRKATGLTHFVKAHLKDGNVLSLHAQESYRMQSYAESNALLVVEEGSEGHAKGAEVDIIVLPEHRWK